MGRESRKVGLIIPERNKTQIKQEKSICCILWWRKSTEIVNFTQDGQKKKKKERDFAQKYLQGWFRDRGSEPCLNRVLIHYHLHWLLQASVNTDTLTGPQSSILTGQMFERPPPYSPQFHHSWLGWSRHARHMAKCVNKVWGLITCACYCAGSLAGLVHRQTEIEENASRIPPHSE